MRRYYGFSTNRTMCDVLNEMRKCVETGNYSYLPGLIEEVQTMGNRMESKLYDRKEIRDAEQHTKDLKEEIAKLERKRDEVSNDEKS